MLVLLVQRGRLFKGDGVGRSDCLRDAGVGVAATLGWGAASEGLGMAVFLPAVVGAGCGRPDIRRTLDMVVRATLPTELPRRLEEPIGVVALPESTTDDAGELPGVVSGMLFVAGLSMVTMLEMESRNCCVLTKLMSSNVASITLMLAFSASVLAFISDNSLKVSPFTVSRSLTPFCTIVVTRSMADT